MSRSNTRLWNAFVIIVVGVCGAPLGSAAADLLQFDLDIGSVSDNDNTQPIYLVDREEFEDWGSNGERDWRTLAPGNTFHFRANAESLGITDPMGVPYIHAIIEIDYDDVVNEANCSTVTDRLSYCRPRLETLLNYSTTPPCDWHPLGGFGGATDPAQPTNWKCTSQYIEANPWQTLRAIDGFLEFRVYYPTPKDGPGDDLPMDRITLHFVDDETFHSEREDDRVARNLHRMEHEETTVLDPELANQCFLVFSRNYLEKIYPNTVPEAAELVDEIRTFELAGESEPVSLAIHAVQGMTNVVVTGGSLTLVDWSGLPVPEIPADKVRVAAVMFADKRWCEWGSCNVFGTQPWYLDTAGLLDVPSGESRQFWVTIDVPPGTPRGTYKGYILIDAVCGGQILVHRVGLSVTVYNLELDAPAAPPYFTWSWPYNQHQPYAANPDTATAHQAAHDIPPVITVYPTLDANAGTVDLGDLEVNLATCASLGLLPPEPRVYISDNIYVDHVWDDLCPGVPGEPLERDCPAFDALYIMLLEDIQTVFDVYNCVPVVSYRDEPNDKPGSRRTSNYLNRVARDVGLRTWVTYSPLAEKPLSGYFLTFDDVYGPVARDVPSWVGSDPDLVGYWNFDEDADDLSPHHNNAELHDDATVDTLEGVLSLPSEQAHVEVPHDDSLNLTDAATICFWFHPLQCTSTYARSVISKTPGSAPRNYALYFYGDDGGASSSLLGRLHFYGTLYGTLHHVAGYSYLDCDAGMSQWYNVIWQYDGASGGAMYVNGRPYHNTNTGSLETNTSALHMGYFAGELDNMFILRRTLADEELEDIAAHFNQPFDQGQTVLLTLDEFPGDPPSSISFAIHDGVPMPAGLETLKSLRVNGETVWSCDQVDHIGQVYTVPLEADPLEEICFSVVNRYSRQEEVRVFFMEPEWRQANWTVTTDDAWSHTFTPDPDGYYGPMDPWLDVRVHSLYSLTPENIQRTRDAGDDFAYYTTYPCTQAVPINNRFLHGVYASAVGTEGVYGYAYASWGDQPWDDLEMSYLHRLGTRLGRIGCGGYQVALPAWEDRMYDTVVFETMREGIEDSRIIAMVNAAIEAHPGDPCAALADAYLADVLARPSLRYYDRYMLSKLPEDRIAWKYDRSPEILTDLAGDPEAYDFFDKLRARLLLYTDALTGGIVEDCNTNCLNDCDEVLLGLAADENGNGVPDECDPLLPGDLDGDGDVDLEDFVQWQNCYTGPLVPCLHECDASDLDGDGDVDLGDFAKFQEFFTGDQGRD